MKFEHSTSIGVEMKTFWTEFYIFIFIHQNGREENNTKTIKSDRKANNLT